MRSARLRRHRASPGESAAAQTRGRRRSGTVPGGTVTPDPRGPVRVTHAAAGARLGPGARGHRARRMSCRGQPGLSGGGLPDAAARSGSPHRTAAEPGAPGGSGSHESNEPVLPADRASIRRTITITLVPPPPRSGIDSGWRARGTSIPHGGSMKTIAVTSADVSTASAGRLPSRSPARPRRLPHRGPD
jgi:hypothetical protein